MAHVMAHFSAWFLFLYVVVLTLEPAREPCKSSISELFTSELKRDTPFEELAVHSANKILQSKKNVIQT